MDDVDDDRDEKDVDRGGVIWICEASHLLVSHQMPFAGRKP